MAVDALNNKFFAIQINTILWEKLYGAETNAGVACLSNLALWVDELQARAVCIGILQTFYLAPYSERDFYEEFQGRLKAMADQTD